MTQLLIVTFSSLLGGLSSGTLAWLITAKSIRKKANATAVASELDNIDRVIGIWKKLTEDQDIRIKKLERQISELLEKICLKPDCKNRVS